MLDTGTGGGNFERSPAAAKAAPQATNAAPGHRASRGGAHLERAERTLCGTGAVTTAAAAEGMALSGLRAARLLSDEEARPSMVTGALAPWILHRTTAQRARAGNFGAFELVAGDAQEAVDQCLVAHLAGVAGDLLVDPGFADRLSIVRPLATEAVETLLAESAQNDNVVADESALSAALATAFARARERLGRPLGPLALGRLEDAELVVVTTNDARPVLAELADSLRRAGVRVGVVGLAQLRPFPARELVDALAGKQRVVVAEPGWARGRLEAAVGAAVGNGSTPATFDPFAANAEASLVRALGRAVTLEAKEVAPAQVTLAAVPASQRAEELLSAVAARLAELGPFELSVPDDLPETASSIAIGKQRARSTRDATLDLLLVAHPVLFDVAVLGERLREGATLVFTTPGAESELTTLQRQLIAKRRMRVFRFDETPSAELEARDPAAPVRALERGVLEALAPAFAERLGFDEKRVRALGGEALLRAVELPTAVARAKTTPTRPRLPAESATGQPAAWRDAIRRFHVTGEGGAGAAELIPLAPLAVSALLREHGGRSAFPLHIDETRDPIAEPLASLLARALDADSSLSLLRDHLPRLVLTANLVLSASASAEPFDAAMERVLAAFAGELELSTAARASLERELATLRTLLPKRGHLLGLTRHAHIELYARVCSAIRSNRREAFLGEVRSVASRLRELLRLEASRDARSPESVAAVLGESNEFVDAAAFAKNLPKRHGSRALSQERKARIEHALASLEAFARESETASELTVVHPGLVPDAIDLGRSERVRHSEGFDVAAGLFDGVARRMAALFGALRAARLELDGAYDPALHDDVLARLEWRGFSPEELALVPPIVVLDTSERVWRGGLDALSRLIRSGRPVHVLIEDGSVRPDATPGLGNVLVAHRDAFVLQAGLGSTRELAAGYARMARGLGPSIALVEPRPRPGPMPAWLELEGALEGRTLPSFRYDPAGGRSWAECFSIDGNPAPDGAWPTRSVEIERADGELETLSLAFTFADAAALRLGARGHFWLIPRAAWSDDQIPISEYVAALEKELPQQVPFLWVLGDDGVLGRAIVSRELAFACRDRLRVWHVIQELGGSDNEHARRAAERARSAAASEAASEKRALLAAHAAELERVRLEEAQTALNRLARALVDPQALLTGPATIPAAPPSPSPAAESTSPAPAAPPTAAPAPVEEESVSFSDPFVDTPLCTSCNECTNLNPLMFKYNADKQATLADAKAGTFLQLVTAAEKCPASCIHPGAPRKDDATANDELVARAARFN